MQINKYSFSDWLIADMKLFTMFASIAYYLAAPYKSAVTFFLQINPARLVSSSTTQASIKDIKI